MNNCSVHNTPLKPLFTSWYCPTCESPAKKATSTSSDWLFEGVWDRAWGEPVVAAGPFNFLDAGVWLRAGWDSKDLNKVHFIKLNPNRNPKDIEIYNKDRYVVSEKLANFIRNNVKLGINAIYDLALVRKT